MTNQWIMALQKPDPDAPKPLVEEDSQILPMTFARFEGINLVRILLFERLEGLVFDQDNNLLGINPSMIEKHQEFVKYRTNETFFKCVSASQMVKIPNGK